LAKLATPFPDRFIQHGYATDEEEFFDIPVAETKAEV
jgi:hypothetical protein